MNGPRCVCALFAGLLLAAAAHADASYVGPQKVVSASGQFIVTYTPNHSWFYHRPQVDLSTNSSYLRLEPSLLAISAEHFKSALWRAIGLSPNTSWSGKIFLALHPARSTNETVLIATDPFMQYWNYRLQLPDLIRRTRYSRALSAVILMEYANRKTPTSRHPAMIPPWLADGLARQVEEADATRVILSAPTGEVNGLPLTRIDKKQRGIDPLAASRRVLQNHPALTFNQLSWPDDAQENGDDGGVYLASVQLFVCDLLKLPEGPAKLRDMLVRLPHCENWQTAFLAAFHDDFQSPLAVEKWWALRVVAFAARDPGPLWTSAVSRQKLDAILSVPVDVRSASNALPSHAEISLQATIRSFRPPQQTEILQTKLRDLNLVQLRLAPSLASIGNGYRNALSDFLTYEKKHTSSRRRRSAEQQFIHQLDTLDQRRQKLETQLKRQELPVPTPGNKSST